MGKIFDTTDKKSIAEFNIEEARGWIINELNNRENEINRLLITYFKPDDEYEFKKYFLNTAVISFGAKIKVLRGVNLIKDKSILSKIQLLGSIRNGFAHAPLITTYQIKLTKERENNKIDTLQTMDVMNSNGEIKTKNARDYLNDFYELNYEIRDALDNIYIDLVKKIGKRSV